jgi:hypothetical protein
MGQAGNAMLDSDLLVHHAQTRELARAELSKVEVVKARLVQGSNAGTFDERGQRQPTQNAAGPAPV